MVDRQAITHALSDVTNVGGSGNIVLNNRVQRVDIEERLVKIALVLPTSDRDEKHRIEDACLDAVGSLDGVDDVSVVTTSPQQDAGGGRPGAGGWVVR